MVPLFRTILAIVCCTGIGCMGVKCRGAPSPYGVSTVTVRVYFDRPIQLVAVTTALYFPGLTRAPLEFRPFHVQR